MNIIITISITAFLVLYAGLFKANKALLPLTIVGLLTALGFTIFGWNGNAVYYGMMQTDNFALAFSSICIVGTILIFLLTQNYFSPKSENKAEYYTLILFSLAGMIMMASYTNMAMLFVGLEIMSVSLYILAGIRKTNFASNEASLKYFLMGAFSTGFLLFGITLIYGATGTFDLATIKEYLINNRTISPIFYPGVILMMIGLCFKVGAAPFHFWVPDVYEGSPSLIMAFMSTVVKVASFAAFLRLFAGPLAPLHDFWVVPLLVIVCLTLFIGNVTALFQKNFKRMLAYSSVSHAGYILFALINITKISNNSVLIYVTAYTFATIIAFAVLILVKQKTGGDNFDSYNGLAKRNPLIALCLTVAMLSLAGIPLTAGFIGKYLMFVNVLTDRYEFLLVGFAILNALVGFYYYFKVIVAMYFKDGPEIELSTPVQYKVALLISVAITIVLGVYPAIVLNLI